MKKIRRVSFLLIILSMLFSFSSYAMYKNASNDEPRRKTPLNTETYSEWRWTWIGNSSCVYYEATGSYTTDVLKKKYDSGLLAQWAESDTNGIGVPKTRYTYSGKWNQDINGIWSFKFDDMTIPVGVTKIDNVLYAFNGLGELKEGYNYYGDLKTATDGLVPTDNAEVNKWLETEYLPDCTSHE